jgi:hypothetical protein
VLKNLFKWLHRGKNLQVSEPVTCNNCPANFSYLTHNGAVALATWLEKALAPDCHVGLTGSMLYGSRPGYTATMKDIDIIVYPHGSGYIDTNKLMAKLNALGFVFKRYASELEYGKLGLPSPKVNTSIWVMEYQGVRVDIQIRR